MGLGFLFSFLIFLVSPWFPIYHFISECFHDCHYAIFHDFPIGGRGWGPSFLKYIQQIFVVWSLYKESIVKDKCL